MPPARKPPLERLKARVVIDDNGCWIWTGSKYGNGYACFFNGDKNVTGHSAAYKLFVGPIPHGKELDHSCNVRACVNPDHLEAVTHTENKRREVERRTHCSSGHEFTPENTYVYRGYKRCRECRKKVARRHYDPVARRARTLREGGRGRKAPPARLN